jgi:hypothetical protein
MANIFIYSNINDVFNRAKEIMAAIADGERLAELYSDLGTLLQYTPKNTIALRQEVAGAISSANKYVS